MVVLVLEADRAWVLRVIGVVTAGQWGVGVSQSPDAAAGLTSAPAEGSGLQRPLWLPPCASQCYFWHLRPPYKTPRHRAHSLLAMSLPVIRQLELAQTVAFIAMVHICDWNSKAKFLAIPLSGWGG